jgi:hypothetical protein
LIGLNGLIGLRLAVITSFTEHHHFAGHNFDTGMLHAFGIFPAASLQTTFDIDLLAFREVLFAYLRLVATVKVVTGRPEGVYRISGSRPR